jgi:hypothetical protein
MTDQLTNCITFNSPPTEEVLRLDKEGFHYKGQFIADAGEAHRLMVEFLKQNTKPEPQGPTDEDLVELFNENDWNYISPETFLDISRSVLELR